MLSTWHNVAEVLREFIEKELEKEAKPQEGADRKEDQTKRLEDRILFASEKEEEKGVKEEEKSAVDIMELDGSWVLDSGASRNAMSEKKAEPHRKQFTKIKERVFETAAGETTSKFGVNGLIEMFRNTAIEVYLMPDKDCPSLLSIGTLERKGYTFIWNYGYLPCLVPQMENK